MKLEGNFRIPAAHFTNGKIQGKIDLLSKVSQGVKHAAPDHAAADRAGKVVSSDLMGRFALSQGILTFSYLHFLIPGTHADLTGQYSLDGNTFDFHGMLRLDARLSQMTTGWKSKLLRPIDPFFEKDGAGTEIPFKISGTREAPRFGLDFRGKDEFKENHLPETRGPATIAQ